MEEFENNETQKFDINLVDFPFICRICLKRSGSRLFKVEDYLLDLYLTITKINVRSTPNLPKNICNDCIKTLEDISSFVDICKYKDAISGKNFIPKNENEHEEPAKCGTSQIPIIKSEEAIEEYQEDLQYFKGFEICQICYSANILKPVEGEAHLMQIFQNITNFGEKAEIALSKSNRICNKCINELETISLFISVSLFNEMKLKIAVGTDMGYESLHTIIDMKEEIDGTSEASIGQLNKNRENSFNESSSEETPFDHDPCKDEYSTGTHLKNMLKGLDINHEIQSGTNRFKCDSCDESFTMKKNLKRHNILTHTEEKPFKCGCCEKSFNQKNNLKQHMFIHAGEKPFKCECCEGSFTRKRNLQQHMIIHTGEKQFKCDCCEKSFTRKFILQRHMLIHSGEKPFKCECSGSCEKRFTQKCSLQQHMVVHSGEKPFKCECCQKSFTLRGILQKHMVIHSEEKPFKCGSCEKSFTRKDSLQRHVFIHSGEKPFKCECCERSFTLRGTLQEHMVIHSGEKPFKCGSCEKSFTRKFILQRHMFIHSGEKPFKCECCEKSFTLRGTLQEHMVIHSGEKPLKCARKVSL